MAFPLQQERLQKVLLCGCLCEYSKYECVIDLYFYETVNVWVRNTKKNSVPEVQVHMMPFVQCEIMKQRNDISLLHNMHKKIEYRVSWKECGR
jgi:hypothetical protein